MKLYFKVPPEADGMLLHGFLRRCSVSTDLAPAETCSVGFCSVYHKPAQTKSDSVVKETKKRCLHTADSAENKRWKTR